MGQSPSSSYNSDSEDLVGLDNDTTKTGERGTGNQQFLVEHSFERSGRSLLSKSDILYSFQHQAANEENVRRRHSDNDEVKRATATTQRCNKEERIMQNVAEVLSSAPTDATRKISNVDVSSPKRRFRERAQAKRMQQQQKLGGSISEDIEDDQEEASDTTNEGGFLSACRRKLQSQRIKFTCTDSAFSTQTRAKGLSPAVACLSGSYGAIGAIRSSRQKRKTSAKVLELQFQALTISKYEHEWRLAKRRSSSSSIARSRRPRDIGGKRNIMYATNEEPFLGLRLTGSLGLFGFDEHSSSHHEKDYLILRDSKGIPLAVCALKSPHEPPVVRIYATKPCIEGQISAGSSSFIAIAGPNVDLYAFAEMRTEGSFPYPAVRYTVYLSAGQEGKFEKDPKYRGSHPVPGSSTITFVGRSGKELIYRGCCLLTVDPEEDVNESFFHLSLSKGIDPALFLCLAAIIDEVAMWRKPPQKNNERRRYV